jgi:Heterokaryon incompatibility protein (HET)
VARIEGLDPEKVSIRSRPYDFEEDRMLGSQLRYIGQLDQIGEPESSLPESPPRSPKVNLDIRDQLYQYHFLRPDRKQIRLLRLGPKDEDSVIHTLELQTFDLSEAPRFYALSYVWGQPDKNMPLPCNGGEIMLTANLFRAIHKTFSRFPDVWLWADGICINQNDLIERGNQVNMMGEIYGRATLVIAHTGHHEYKMVPVDSESVSPLAVETVHTNQTVGIEDLQLSDTPPIDSSDNEESTIDSGAHHSEEDTNLLDTSQPAISLMNYLTRIWTSDGDYSLMEDKDVWIIGSLNSHLPRSIILLSCNLFTPDISLHGSSYSV